MNQKEMKQKVTMKLAGLAIFSLLLSMTISAQGQGGQGGQGGPGGPGRGPQMTEEDIKERERRQ